VGIAWTFPPENAGLEFFLAACMMTAQGLSLMNYWRKKTFRYFSIVLVILVWAVGFWLRRLQLIDTGAYAVFVVTFLGLVIYIRIRP
jgi:hypothetical protein